jgi:hypothetical protein
MPSIGIEVSTRCKSCGNVVAVNAFAPGVACSSCTRALAVDATRWMLLLEEPLRVGPGLPLHTEHNAPFATEDGTFYRVYRREDVACRGCGAQLAEDRLRQMAARGGGFCSGCGKPVVVRAAPELLHHRGVAAVVGEDVEQATGAAQRVEPVPLACASCGGNLRVDGGARLVRCQFCQFDQYLPDDLWRHFHPVKPVARWHLVFTEAAARAPAPGGAPATWEDLADVILDAYGNLYACGTRVTPDFGGQEFAVWSMTPDLRMRWARTGLQLDGWDARLALAPSGHVLLWQKDKRTVHVLSCADGGTVAKLSGKPGEGAALEMKDTEDLACDRDGTLLLRASGDRLLRTTPFGEPIATWGQGPREPRPEEDPDSHVVCRLGARPLFLMAASIAVGWDGFTYFVAGFSVDDAIEAARYDRSGQQLYRARIKQRNSTWTLGRGAADVRGCLYVLAKDDDSLLSAWRIAPDGRSGERLIASRQHGGPLGPEEKMAVGHEGTIWLLGNEGAARRFGADGRVQLISDGAREADRKALEADDD